MTRPVPILLLAAVLAGAPAVLTAQEPARADHADRIARVEASLVRPLQVRGLPAEEWTLEERMAAHAVPGVSIAVIDGGEVVWERAYGVKDAGTGAPVTPETLFQAASISKPVAVMGMLRLVEAGRLDLDAPVSGYLESWTLPAYDFDEPVTLRRLASHTAGTTVSGFPGYARSAARPGTAGVLRGAGNTDPVVVDLEPGSEWRYSGGGTTILQLVVEDVTGRPFPEYMAEAVLEPAGMAHSTFEQPLPEARWGDAASGHEGDGSVVAEGWHVYPEMAAAGLWTTAGDLARLAVEVQRSLRGESNRVLSPEMTAEMLTPVRNRYGLGFGTHPATGRFGHGGANRGFRATLHAFRDGRGVVVMTNGDRGGPLYSEILAAVGRVYGWPELQPDTLPLAALPAARRAAIAGRYAVPAMGIAVTITATDDGLFLATSDGDAIPPTTLVPVSETVLVDRDDGSRITIEWDGDRVVRMRTQGVELVPDGG